MGTSMEMWIESKEEVTRAQPGRTPKRVKTGPNSYEKDPV